LGQNDNEKVQSIDMRKGYLVDESKNIGTTIKTMSVSISYKTEPDLVIRKLLTDTAQVYGYLA
jgi:hypothetical protein